MAAGADSDVKCSHLRVMPEVCDQTLGVYCADCDESLGVCWMNGHFSESVWNRACAYAKSLPVTGDPLKDWHEAVPCEQDRDDVCGLCGEQYDLDGCQLEPYQFVRGDE